jgi:long-chain acyl-CoA synthetase
MVEIEVIGICSVNREEWLVTDLACNLIDVTSVPLYETLGDEMLETILCQTEMTTLFGSDICLKNILKLITGKKTNLKNIVTFDKTISD